MRADRGLELMKPLILQLSPFLAAALHHIDTSSCKFSPMLSSSSSLYYHHQIIHPTRYPLSTHPPHMKNPTQPSVLIQSVILCSAYRTRPPLSGRHVSNSHPLTSQNLTTLPSTLTICSRSSNHTNSPHPSLSRILSSSSSRAANLHLIFLS